MFLEYDSSLPIEAGSVERKAWPVELSDFAFYLFVA